MKFRKTPHIFTAGMIMALALGILSLVRLIIIAIYILTFASSCQVGQQTCSPQSLQDHLFYQSGVNFISIVGFFDLLIACSSALIARSLRYQRLSVSLQVSYFTLLLVNLAASIVSLNQMKTYQTGSEGSALVIACNVEKDKSSCSFVESQRRYKELILAVSIPQFIVAIAYKIALDLYMKRGLDELQKKLQQSKQAEDFIMPVYNSRGKPFTVRELYNMGKN